MFLKRTTKDKILVAVMIFALVFIVFGAVSSAGAAGWLVRVLRAVGMVP